MDNTTTPECSYIETAGKGNEAGHALLHMLESMATLSVSQTFRQYATGAAAGLLVAFLFTVNWWIFAALCLAIAGDIFLWSLSKAIEVEIGTWYNFLMGETKELSARSRVLAAIVHMKKEEKGE